MDVYVNRVFDKKGDVYFLLGKIFINEFVWEIG